MTGPAGSVYNKYETRNPAARFLVSRYIDSLLQLVRPLRVDSVLEIGCGEGHVIRAVGGATSCAMAALDLDQGIVKQARRRFSTAAYVCADGMRLPFRDDSFELVLACEVMEHVDSPVALLQEMKRVSRRFAVASVPREPLWRVLNLLRGAYWNDLGNTPGHVQHWNRHEFLSLLAQHMRIRETRTPLPWTMALCEVG